MSNFVLSSVKSIIKSVICQSYNLVTAFSIQDIIEKTSKTLYSSRKKRSKILRKKRNINSFKKAGDDKHG